MPIFPSSQFPLQRETSYSKLFLSISTPAANHLAHQTKQLRLSHQTKPLRACVAWQVDYKKIYKSMKRSALLIGIKSFHSCMSHITLCF